MIRNFLKAAYYFGLSMIKIDRRALGALAQSECVTILNLHRVSCEKDPYWPPMHPDLFREFLVWLASTFTVATLGQLADLKTNRPVAVLSFDDGYFDFIQYALPLLGKYGFVVNMNVIPECAETGRPMWNVRLYDFLRSASFDQIRRVEVPGFTTKLESDSEKAKCRFGLAISRFLKNRPRAERMRLWEPIESAINGQENPSTRMMTTKEISQIAGYVELGVHSYSHESMGFESDEFFLDDLDRCEAYFNDKIRVPLSIYAFPNGSYRTSQIDLLRSRGIKKILLVDEKTALRNSDVLPRRTMYGESAAELRFQTLGY
jgi:peptidoglycan/xylan/chitin deacetylase (PgdA/CDA1 family)